MALRAYGDGKSPSGVTYVASIYDTDWTDPEFFFPIQHDGIKIEWRYDKPDDPTWPIYGSIATIDILEKFDDADLQSLRDDIRTSSEGRFFIEITSDGTYSTCWRGIITADTLTNETDEGGYSLFSISAVCGLALLKTVPYYNSGTLYSGGNKLIEHIATCLKKLPHVSTFWPGSEAFIETSLDWWDITMSSGGANDALNLAKIDHSAFYDYHTTGSTDKDVLSCYDVLRHIGQSFGCRIKMLGGVFVIEQIDYRANSSYEYRLYSKTPTQLSHASYSGVNTINQTATSGAKLTYVQYDYIPQLKKTAVTYEALVRRNFWGNIILSEGSTFSFDQNISSNSAALVFRVRGVFFINIKNNSYSGNPQDILIPEMRLSLKIGSNYLKRTVTFANFAAHYSNMEWTASSSDKCSIVVGAQQVPASGVSASFIQSFDFLTPALPSDGDLNSVSATFFQLKKNDGSDVDETQFTITWSAGSLWLEAFDNGTPDVNEDSLLYEATNPGGGTDVWETSIRLGGYTQPNAAGKLTNSGGTELSQWGQGAGSRDKPLGQLLGAIVLNGRLRPKKRLSGQLYGSALNPRKLIRTSDSIDYLDMRLIWHMTDNVLDGDWWEIEQGSAANPETPIKVKILTGGTGKVPIGGNFPTTGTPTTNGNQGFASNSPPAVLQPLAFNTLSSAITSGATITSISVTNALAGNEFLVGDEIVVVHPVSGKYQKFSVSSVPTGGATSISVTSAIAEFDVPQTAGLFIQQKAYAFSLPAGTHEGSILRWDDVAEVWEPYDGTTDGHVLTWDTTNGWQAEAASGGGVSDGDKGDITVSSSGTVWAIDNSAVTLAKMADVASGTVFYRTTTGSGAPEVQTLATLKTDLGLTGTNSGDQTITLTGDVTGSGTGSFAATIANSAVTYAKIQNVSTNNRILGRSTSGAGVVEEITVGSGLSLSGGTLSATATGDITNGGNTTGATVTIGTNDNNALALETNNVTRLSISSGASTGGDLTLTGVTANTSTVQDRIIVQTNSTGTPLTGFGGGVLFRLESSTTDNTDALRLDAIWTDPTHASRTSALVYSTVATGGAMTERFRLTNTSMVTNVAYTFGNSANTVTFGGSSGLAIVSSTAASTAAIQLSTSNVSGGVTVGSNAAYTSTTLNKQKMRFSTDSYAAASGTGTLTSIYITDTYNLTGTASGNQKGIWIQPTLTSLTAATYYGLVLDFNNANARGISQTGESTTNYLEGKTTINRTTAGTGSNNAFLNLNGGAITGDTELIRGSANISSEMIAVFANARNTGGTGDVRIEANVGGTSAGDPYMMLTVTGGTTTVLGVDNSDSDKFKITPGGTKPGSTANKGMVLTTDAATLVGINKDAPKHALDVTGRGMSSTGFIGTGSKWISTNFSFGTGAGTSPTFNSSSGTDNAFTISFTTGTTPTANGTIFTATYPNAWPGSWNTSFVVFSALNANAATDITKFRISTATATSFLLVANGTLSASTNYQLTFFIWSMDSA